MGETTIRPMTVRDIGGVFELGSRCYDQSAIPYNYWTQEEVATHFDTSPELCLVAEADGRIVGLLLGDQSFETDRQTAYLEWLAVDPDHRRHGMARRLTEAALAKAEELGKTRVVVDIANPNAASRALAEDLGFEEEVSVTYYAKRLR